MFLRISLHCMFAHIYSSTYLCFFVCVRLCDIFGWRKKYKHVSSAAIQSPPPPMGLSTPNIMSFILSVKIIDYTETDGWIHPSILSKRSQFFFKKAKNIWSTFSNKINALPPPHCFLKRKMFVKCNDTRCLMYRYVRSIKITKLQHAVLLSENWSHFVRFLLKGKNWRKNFNKIVTVCAAAVTSLILMTGWPYTMDHGKGVHF